MKSVFIKVAGLRRALKRDSSTRFPVKFAKFLRTLILKDICERLLLRTTKFCFVDYFYFSSSSLDDFIGKKNLQKLSILREFCKKTGLQILLREYDLMNKKQPPFTEEDILNIFPVVKCVTPKATDATAIFEAAQARLQSGMKYWGFLA